MKNYGFWDQARVLQAEADRLFHLTWVEQTENGGVMVAEDLRGDVWRFPAVMEDGVLCLRCEHGLLVGSDNLTDIVYFMWQALQCGAAPGGVK